MAITVLNRLPLTTEPFLPLPLLQTGHSLLPPTTGHSLLPPLPLPLLQTGHTLLHLAMERSLHLHLPSTELNHRPRAQSILLLRIRIQLILPLLLPKEAIFLSLPTERIGHRQTKSIILLLLAAESIILPLRGCYIRGRGIPRPMGIGV